MRLDEIHLNHLGVLKAVSLDEIPRLSVVHGGNGSGKTTLARFVRDTLLAADSLTTHRPDEQVIGSIQVADSRFRWNLSCHGTAAGQERTTVQLLDGSEGAGTLKPRFPEWVTHQVFHEVLCPGYEEADQFTLLTRLCIETAGSADAEAEIQRTRQAIAEAIREREGTAGQPGLTQQITELQRQRDALNRDLANLKRQDPAVLTEIHSVEERTSDLRTRNLRIKEDTERTRSEMASLERQIAELRECNQLALDQQRLRGAMAELTARNSQWNEIRRLIDRETQGLQMSGIAALNRSSHSIRAVVDRLEERMALREAEHDERWHQHVQQETTALCRFVTQQQESARACERRLESQIGAEAEDSVQRVQSLLQEQITTLQEELDRAENILSDSLHQGSPECDSEWHRDYRYENHSADTAMDSLESRLQLLQRQLELLFVESTSNSDDIHRLTRRLEDLQRQRQAVPSLEKIDELRARLAEIEARLELLASQRDVLLSTEHSLNQVVSRLSQRQLPAALEIASPWLSRLTNGECVRVQADTARQTLLVQTTTSDQPMQISQLSQGTQHQLALVLRLALLRAHSQTSGQMPLIIDDVFITSDDDRGSAAADLLRDVAADGQQIMLLTCQNDVRALLAARGARVYSLSAPVPVPAPEPPAAPEQEPEAPLVFKAFDGSAEECPGELHDTVIAGDNDSHWLFYLEPEHPVSNLSGIEISELNGLTAGGLESIEQLLTCSIPDVKERIQNAGFFITEDRLRELQTQAVMVVCIPMLRQRDAELLVAAGIDSIRQLARLRPEAIFEVVERFQQSDSGARFLRGGRTVDQEQAISWNRWALHARTVDRARSAASARKSRHSRSVGILSSSQRTRPGLSSRRDSSRRSGESQHRLRARVSGDSRRRREVRSERRRQRRGQSETGHETTVTPQELELKFYLHRSSEVEAAPSIGSKTAARLARVGVETVDNLLESDADTLATLLDNHRITPTVIEEWKAQAALVCTIPRLRGHDAQILVACGKNDADEIVDLSPEQLFSVVQPFCDTTEGTRIVRSGRKPDLREVTDWISWAQQSRSLEAA